MRTSGYQYLQCQTLCDAKALASHAAALGVTKLFTQGDTSISSRRRPRKLLSQYTLQHLPIGISRNHVDKCSPLRQLEPGQLAVAMLQDVIFLQGVTFPHHNRKR